MLVRSTAWVLRVAGILALILGILDWFDLLGSFILIHMVLGIIVVLALWILGFAIITARGGSVGLGAGAIVLGLLVLLLGLSQQTLLVGPAHWIIQVLHLLLGLGAIGMGEAINGRYRRLNVATQAVH